MRAVSLALVLTLVLVAPLALATCQHCNDGVLTTACALAEYPTEAEGMVTMHSSNYVWRACFAFYWDYNGYYYILGGCTDPIHYTNGTWVARLILSQPATSMIGASTEGQIYWSGWGWATDASATAIEYCNGYCEF